MTGAVQPFPDAPGRTLTVLVGVHGSGKTTLGQEMVRGRADAELLDDPFDPGLLGLARARHVVVCHPVFCYPHGQEMILAAAGLHMPGAEVRWVWFENDLGACVANLERRMAFLDEDPAGIVGRARMASAAYVPPPGVPLRPVFRRDAAPSPSILDSCVLPGLDDAVNEQEQRMESNGIAFLEVTSGGADGDDVTEALRPAVEALPKAQARMVRDFVFEHGDTRRCLRSVSQFVLKAAGIEDGQKLAWSRDRDAETDFAAWLGTLETADGRAPDLQVLTVETGTDTGLFVVLPSSLDVAKALSDGGIKASVKPWTEKAAAAPAP